MIDIHCHILPAMDDGAKDIEQSLFMCRSAAHDGVKHIIATPHALNKQFDPDPNELIEKVSLLNGILRDESLDLIIHPGSEARLVPDMAEEISNKPWLLLASSQYLLVEPPPLRPSFFVEEITKLQAAGYIPVLAHPERCDWIQENPDLLLPLVESGMLVQITAQALLGQFGSPARLCAETLIRCRTAHIMASDAHSPHRRPPLLSQARELLQELAGVNEAMAMVTTRPEAILHNVPIELAEPVPYKTSFWKRIFS